MNAETFWLIGHGITKHSLRHGATDSAMRCFREFFGAPPTICTLIWNILYDKDLIPPDAHPRHLMWTLFYLKTYNTCNVTTATLGCCENTFRKWRTIFLELIAYHLDVVSHRPVSNFCLHIACSISIVLQIIVIQIIITSSLTFSFVILYRFTLITVGLDPCLMHGALSRWMQRIVLSRNLHRFVLSGIRISWNERA